VTTREERFAKLVQLDERSIVAERERKEMKADIKEMKADQHVLGVTMMRVETKFDNMETHRVEDHAALMKQNGTVHRKQSVISGSIIAAALTLVGIVAGLISKWQGWV